MTDPAIAPIPVAVRPEHLAGRPLSELRTLISSAASAAANPSADDVLLTGMALGSAVVHPGDLFVGLPGLHRHGAEFAAQAAARGAVALLTDAAGAGLAAESGLPTLVVDADPRTRLGEVAAWLYDTAHARPTLMGVTGTNGKTSTVHLLEAMLRQLGEVAGLSSTAERIVAGRRVVAGLTTPEAPELHALIARMTEVGVTGAALEVSAQALTRRRVDGVVFDVMGFTNLTHDHLDDYADMEEYYAAKAALFTPEHARLGVVSLESEPGARLVGEARIPVVTISDRPGADYLVTVLAEEPGRTTFRLTRGVDVDVTTSIPILGAHMARNAGLAIALLVETGRDPGAIADALAGGVDAYLPGRLELVSPPGAPAIYVDFGHTPDAFGRSLDAVRRVTTGKLVMVFGADGDRDATKRPDMARVAVTGSDALVITDHHPRFEDPHAIRATLMAAARAARPDAELYEVGDPKQAIRKAVTLVGPGDAILWCGPGHQNYRDIEGVRTDYSARAEARDALEEAGWGRVAPPWSPALGIPEGGQPA